MWTIAKGILGFVFLLGAAGAIVEAQAAPLTLEPTSRLWVQGTSNVRDFTCTAGSLAADVASDGDSDVAHRVAAGERAIATVDVTVSAPSLDCGNKKMTEHMLKAIKAADHPVIEFRLTSYTLAADSSAQHAALDGTLSLGGTEKPIHIDARVEADTTGALHVSGAYVLRMTDFGLKPPTLMLGAFKVHDPVTVDFDLLLRN